jgi:hypothetical protein
MAIPMFARATRLWASGLGNISIETIPNAGRTFRIFVGTTTDIIYIYSVYIYIRRQTHHIHIDDLATFCIYIYAVYTRYADINQVVLCWVARPTWRILTIPTPSTCRRAVYLWWTCSNMAVSDFWIVLTWWGMAHLGSKNKRGNHLNVIDSNKSDELVSSRIPEMPSNCLNKNRASQNPVVNHGPQSFMAWTNSDTWYGKYI